mgnify:FL=1
MATERTHRRHTPNSGPVALFVDWDNFAIGLRQEMPERPPDLGPILRWARRTGTLIVSRAYGEWRDATERLAIYNAGVDAVYAPVLPLGGSLAARSGAGGAKSLADTAMAVDVAEFLTLVPSVQTLILATSDKDLIPVIRFAQKRGVYSGVVGSDRTAAALRELADEFVTYRQLLEEEAPQPIAVSRPVTVPPLRIARPLRRFGDPVADSLSPILREPRPLGTTPTYSRREPVVAPSIEPELEVQAPDPDGESARRRRRGGRRRRGAETLALGDVIAQPDEDVAPATPEPIPAFAPPTQLATTTVPLGTARPPIVPPMIAPRAPRPSAERFAAPVASLPDAGVTGSPQAHDVATPIIAVGEAFATPATASVQPPVDASPTPRASVLPTESESGDPPPARRPRVQLPGERLRRLVPESAPASPAVAVADASAPEAEPVVLNEPQTTPTSSATADAEAASIETHVDASPRGAQLGTADPHLPVSQTLETPPATTSEPERPADDSGAPEATSDEPASRARRRRGGRTARPSADGAATGASTPPPIIDGPIASPNDPDAASAPEPATEGPSRGRRRSGRSRVTA